MKGKVFCFLGVIIINISMVYAEGKDILTNVLEDIPYTENMMGKRELVNEKYLLVMQAALKPGQSVPQHKANSNVNILVVEGRVVINLAGKDIESKKGDLVPVAFKTSMSIKNTSDQNASFLIIKTPNPSEIQ